MKIKRLMTICLCFVLLAGVFAACAANAAPKKGPAGKVLVVYYSATGSTKSAAETVAKTLGADIFELTPVKPYTTADLDWTNSGSRVTREHDDPKLRNVPLKAAAPKDWGSYDTVLIGYPIWWGIAAWPVDGFVKANNFSGKTVIPFGTSLSSGIGQSGSLLAKMAGTGKWQNGERFSSGAPAAEVSKWAQSVIR